MCPHPPPTHTHIQTHTQGNAFGHGLLLAGRAAAAGGADALGVESLEEALALRDGGVRLPVKAHTHP